MSMEKISYASLKEAVISLNQIGLDIKEKNNEAKRIVDSLISNGDFNSEKASVEVQETINKMFTMVNNYVTDLEAYAKHLTTSVDVTEAADLANANLWNGFIK